MSALTKHDFSYINARALDHFESLLAAWLPDGKRQNSEWVARNPVRADKSAGSFSVNIRSWIWCDFAGDERDKGGDPISLYAYLNVCSQGDAARAVAEQIGVTLDGNNFFCYTW